MKITVGTKIAAAFALSLLALVVIGAVNYRSIHRLTETDEWVAHTHKVLENLEGLLSGMKDAETGQRGFLLTGEERYLEPFNASHHLVDEKLRELRKLTSTNPLQQQRLDKLEPLISGKDGKFPELQQTIDLRRADKEKGFEAALAVVKTEKGKIVMDEIRTIVADMENEENDLLAKRTETAQSSADTATNLTIYGTSASFLLIACICWLITRNISVPLRQITGIAEKIAGGDLNVSLPSTQRTDEIGALTQTFRQMTENLRGLMKDILEAVNVLASSASEIMASTTQLAASAAETATAITETTTTVEEVKQASQLSSQKAKSVSEDSQKSAEIAKNGKRSVDQTIEGMSGIRQQMGAVAESILSLSAQSQAIGEIISTVDDLAAQSKLLAVNASIEAAKAGEEGKGFSVVAQEVKSLAEQSKQATTQVRGILNDIQKATSSAVLATEQGSKAVEAGVKQSNSAGESISALSGSITEAAQASTQIAATSQQQFVGMDQVAAAMENIKLASAQTVTSTKQAEVAAQQLHDLGQKLKQLVERFKV